MAFAGDGRLVTGSGDGVVRVWRLPRPEGTPPALAPARPLAALKYLDGSLLLLGRADGSLALWQRFQDRLLWETRPPRGSVQSLAAFPRQGKVYSAGRDGVVRAWRAHDGRLLQELPGDRTELLALAVSGDLLACAGRDRVVHVRRAETGAAVQDLAGAEQAVGALDFSADGRLLAAATAAGGLQVWDTRTWNRVLALPGGAPGAQDRVCLAFSPAGDRLALGAGDQAVAIVELASRRVAVRLEGQNGWGQGAWTQDGRRYVSAGADGRFRVWDPITGSLLLHLPMPPGPLGAMALAPDGRSVALGGRNLALWDAE
jgi:WD40 repeat protein